MTTLMSLIYFASAGVSIVLLNQARRHREETRRACERRGIVPHRPKSKFQIPGSMACIAAGIAIGAPGLGACIGILRDARFRETMAPETLDFCSFLFAAGLTLVLAGCVSLRLNRAFRRGVPLQRRAESGVSSSPPCSGESASGHPHHSSPQSG